MCGICGWIGDQSSETRNHIDRMVDALSKRGPDESAVWTSENNLAMFGHTRLSIIDLARSKQPMPNEDDTVFLAYNGEIYNFADLRKQLIARGHSFRSEGDTEVLVHLYEDYGRKMVDMLDGMYAFAIYDSRRHTLLMARDRIGIKPLYYWHDQATGELLFASDMGSMLANPAVPRRLDFAALASYLHFGFVAHPHSWLRDVRQVEPGQVLEWKDGKIELTRYYTWNYEPRTELGDPERALAELRQTLHESVTSQLIADVPLGSFLSGGLDSSTTTGLAQQTRQAAGETINSFTVRFWLDQYDESRRARSIAGDLGTHHTEIEAKELNFDRCFMERLVAGLGEPFGDTSALAVYLLCQQARPHVKVALSGDGGDEHFLGYSGFRKQLLARRLRSAPRAVRRTAVKLTRNSGATIPRRLNKYLKLSLLDDADLIIDWHRRWEWDELSNLLGDRLFHDLFPSREAPFPELRELIGDGARGGFLEQQMRFHMLVVLPCDGLFKVDRMSMAHGLEVRVPMLSNSMIEYGRHLPLKVRTHNKRTKEPLRSLAEGFSATLAEPSPKQGFGFPLDLWIRSKAAAYWREWDLTRVLASVGFQPEALDKLVNGYGGSDDTGENYSSGSRARRIFDLMLLGVWLDKYQVHA